MAKQWGNPVQLWQWPGNTLTDGWKQKSICQPLEAAVEIWTIVE
jgi:hypothetical protein